MSTILCKSNYWNNLGAYRYNSLNLVSSGDIVRISHNAIYKDGLTGRVTKQRRHYVTIDLNYQNCGEPELLITVPRKNIEKVM